MFKKKGCNVKQHDAGYRSVHYIIETTPTNKNIYIEIQVCTIFEEGWSEVDHTFRYPNGSSNPLTDDLLLILNRLAGSADEMSSFVQGLNIHLEKRQLEYQLLSQEKDKQIKELEDKINSLQISQQDKEELSALTNSVKEAANAAATAPNKAFLQSYSDANRRSIVAAYPDWAMGIPSALSEKFENLAKVSAIIQSASSPLVEAAAKIAAANPMIENISRAAAVANSVSKLSKI